MNFIFGAAAGKNFGNAILSKYQIDEAENHKLQVEIYETRSVVILKTPFFHLNVTHLDHISEDVRLRQYEQIQQHLDFKNSNIFMGDLNALRFQDYSSEKWKKIEKVRKEKIWELPQTELIQTVEKDFLEVFSTYSKEEIPSTCRFDTRIDYIFVSKENNFKIEEIKRIFNDEISDHHPIFMKFSMK
jgi:endonuclease/exonuclease/phosphatase family metal-dependent hydrolase